jgi:hypothetical protein
MIERHPNERLAVLEQKFEHLEDQMQSMARKVDEMHAVLLQAKGFKTVFIVLGTTVAGAFGAIGHWLLAKFG